MKNAILLNDILKIDDISNVKIRLNKSGKDDWDPLRLFHDSNIDDLLKGQYWNYSKNKSFKEGQITIGLIRLEDDLWLLFHVGKVVKDLDIFNGMGYEYQTLQEYEKYFGRLIVRYKNRSQNMVRNAESIINDCTIEEILPFVLDKDKFPGYENINLSWADLKRVLNKEGWKAALENQKGVYLITDSSTGKMYVGSAYGENMILGRWQSYVRNGHGGNVELKKLDFDYIKKHFRYSVLDIFKSTVSDDKIIQRESWWKEVLLTRVFGYNKN